MAANCIKCKKYNEYIDQPYICWVCNNIWAPKRKRYTRTEWNSVWPFAKGECKNCGEESGMHAAGKDYTLDSVVVNSAGACASVALLKKGVKHNIFTRADTDSVSSTWASDFVYEE